MAALKGAFLYFDAGLLGGLPNIVIFQFNPERVSRTPTRIGRVPSDDGSGTSDAGQTPGQPTETMNLTLRLDATDQRAELNPIAIASGILPTLSAIELLMVPKSATVDLAALAGQSGTAHRHPPAVLPTVLFFWGPFRILPVAVTSLSINETEYDPLLIPVRAEVEVGLQVLTPAQAGPDTFAADAYTYTQKVKEVMAALNLANAAEFGLTAALSLSI